MTLRSASSILSAQDYYPFGGILRSFESGGLQEKYKFTGKERDKESGLDYFGARYYDSEIGRWLSVDPMAAKYPGWSPYNYCKNNPLGLVDPDGMDPFFVKGDIKSKEKWMAVELELCKTKTGKYIIDRLYNRIPGEKKIPNFCVIYTDIPDQFDAYGRKWKYAAAMKPEITWAKQKNDNKASRFGIFFDDNKKEYEGYLTVAHESWHIIQYINNYYNFCSNQVQYEDDYENNPNEIEANEIESVIKEQYEGLENSKTSAHGSFMPTDVDDDEYYDKRHGSVE